MVSLARGLGRERAVRATTLAAVTTCAGLVAAALGLSWSQHGLVLNTPVPEPIGSFVPIQVGAAAVWAGAAVVMLRRPEIGWSTLASVASLSHGLAAFAYTWAVRGYVVGAPAPGAAAAAWLVQWLLPIEVAVNSRLAVSVPDGCFPRGRLRALALAAVGLPLAGVIATAGTRMDLTGTDFAPARNPLGGLALPDAVIPLLIAPTAVLTLIVVVVRWRRSGGGDRIAMRRVVVLSCGGPGCTAPVRAGPGAGRSRGSGPGQPGLLALLAVVTRNRLLGIEPALDRALKMTLLTAALLAAYVALVAIGDAALGRSIGPVAAVAVALLALPAHQWFGRLTRRFVYGDRDEPGRVVDAVLAQARATAQPAEMLAAIVTRLADGLRLPWLAVLGPDRDRVLAVVGERAEPGLTSIELVHRGVVVGLLETGPRPGETALGPADQRALAQIAASMAVVVEGVVSAQALRASRDRLVHIREEERRRLRRELHDGLGPILTGAALTTDAARNLVVDDASSARDLLDAARAELTGAITEIRRLVEDLRPPALDDLGLAGALRQHALRFPNLTVRVEAGDGLAELPAAVEVAAYRVAAEAITNAARHAGASTVDVVLMLDGQLEVEIVDDGRTDAPWQAGVGLRSTAERVAEIGGAVEAGPAPDRRGRVRALLPVLPLTP